MLRMTMRSARCFHVGLRRGAILAQRVNNFQIASGFSVFRSEHAHRGEERDTPFAVAVEASQEEHRFAGDVFDTGLGGISFCWTASEVPTESSQLR
jgi:hypothetical protein